LGNGGDPVDYLEVVGAGKPFTKPSVPFVAVPTTAGTGAEVTRNAVLTSTEHGVKASLRGPQLLPAVALVDPELTWSMPPALTATTGLDALAQLLEPFVSVRANPLTDALCREGLPRVARALPRAFANGNDREARREMALASLLGGMALANAGLGAAHGFAGPLGGRFRAPHGALCACLLPGVMRVNRAALAVRGDAAGGRSAERFDELARLLTGCHDAVAADGERFVIDIVNMLCIPSLRSYGIAAADVDLIVPQAAAASSMKGNPIALTAEELREIFVSAW